MPVIVSQTIGANAGGVGQGPADEAKQVKARAARLLGVSERSLWYKLRKHHLS